MEMQGRCKGDARGDTREMHGRCKGDARELACATTDRRSSLDAGSRSMPTTSCAESGVIALPSSTLPGCARSSSSMPKIHAHACTAATCRSRT